MKVTISKEEKGFVLSLKSGHFNGILDSIPKESLIELRDSLNGLLQEETYEGCELVWNPRSKRHERVK